MRAFALSATKGRELEVERLFLPKQGLEEVPEHIRLMENLQVLDLSDNAIKELPHWIGALPKLRHLILNGNKGLDIAGLTDSPSSLQQLFLRSMAWEMPPAGLFQLPQLKYLDLSNNRLQALTKDIPASCPLQTLILDNNQLNRLPKQLENLTRLRKLSANTNQIKRLMADVGNCQDLVDLQLNSNRLTSLPKSIGRLGNLENLAVGSNRLRSLPLEIADCSMLRKLDLANNRLKGLPQGLAQLEWFRELDVSGNTLRKCPEVLAACRRLRKLSLARNKMKHLVDWPAGRVIEDLDCSKNQLTSIQGLAELQRLQALRISNNKIEGLSPGFWRYPHLRSIEAARNPLKIEIRDLLSCPNLEQLEGLLPATQRTQLLRFLTISRQEGWKESDRRLFFDLFAKKKEAWNGISESVAWRGVQVQDPYFAASFRQWLLKHSRRRTPIRKGSTLLFLGSLSSESQGVFASLSELEIHWTRDQDEAATHLIFGTQNLPSTLSKRDLPWYDEAQLTRQLDRITGKPWSREISDEQLEKLRKLLWNQQEVNVRLALQLLRGSGVPRRLIIDLLALYLQAKFPHLQNELKAVLFPYLPDLIRTLLVEGVTPPANPTDLRSWRRWLGTKEINAEALISMLK